MGLGVSYVLLFGNEMLLTSFFLSSLVTIFVSIVQNWFNACTCIAFQQHIMIAIIKKIQKYWNKLLVKCEAKVLNQILVLWRLILFLITLQKAVTISESIKYVYVSVYLSRKCLLCMFSDYCINGTIAQQTQLQNHHLGKYVRQWNSFYSMLWCHFGYNYEILMLVCFCDSSHRLCREFCW